MSEKKGQNLPPIKKGTAYPVSLDPKPPSSSSKPAAKPAPKPAPKSSE